MNKKTSENAEIINNNLEKAPKAPNAVEELASQQREKIQKVLNAAENSPEVEKSAKEIKADLEKALKKNAPSNTSLSSSKDNEEQWRTPWIIRLLFESPLRYIFYPLLPLIWVVDRTEWGFKKGVVGQRRQITESTFEHPHQKNTGVSSIHIHPGYRDQYVFSVQMIEPILNSWQKKHPDKEIVTHSFDITSQHEDGDVDTGFDNLMHKSQMNIVWKKRPTPLTQKELENLDNQHSAQLIQQIEKEKSTMTEKELQQFEKYEKDMKNLEFPVIETDAKNQWALWRYLSFALGSIPFGLKRIFGKNKAINVSTPIELGNQEKQVTLSVSKGLVDTFLKDHVAVLNEAIANWVARYPNAEILRIDGGETLTIRYKDSTDISLDQREKNASQNIPKGKKKVDIHEKDQDATLYKPVRKLKKYIMAPFEMVKKGILGKRRRIMVQDKAFDNDPTQGISALDITTGVRDHEVPRGTVINAAIESWKQANPDKEVFDISDNELSTVTILWKKTNKPSSSMPLKYEKYHFSLKNSKNKNMWGLWRYIDLGIAIPSHAVAWVFGVPLKRLKQSGGEVDLGGGNKRDSFYIFDSVTDQHLHNSAFSITDSMNEWKKDHPTVDVSKTKLSLSKDTVIIQYADSKNGVSSRFIQNHYNIPES